MDDKDLRHEAREICREVRPHVVSCDISTNLEQSETIVYLNIRTQEQEEFCVRLSIQGYQVSYTHPLLSLIYMHKIIFRLGRVGNLLQYQQNCMKYTTSEPPLIDG